MTCVIALIDDDAVCIGSDSLAVGSAWDADILIEPKYFSIPCKFCKGNNLLLGYTGSLRTAQLVQCQLPNKVKTVGNVKNEKEFLIKFIIPAMRKIYLDSGHIKTSDGKEEMEDTWVCIINNRIFKIENDFCVIESSFQYLAMGCAGQIAHGALAVIGDSLKGEEKIIAALTAAEKHNAGVRKPFHVLSLKEKQE